MKKIKKNLRGFTLLELLVALAISTMVLTGALALVLPSNKLFYTTSNLQQEQDASRMLSKGINERLRFATDIVFINNTSNYPTRTNDKFKDYKVICVKTTFDAKGRKSSTVYLKENLDVMTPEKKMIPDHVLGKYKAFINLDAAGYNLDTQIEMYRIDHKDNKVDPLKTSEIITFKNLKLKTNLIKDAVLNPTIDGLNFASAVTGNNDYYTVIIYK